MLRIALLLGAMGCGKVAAPQAADAPPRGDGTPPADAGPGKTALVSTTGNDANDGITQPVKTLKRAIGLALADGEIATISVAAGRYDAANGETFPYTVPSGVTIAGPAGGGAILAGTGTEPGLSLESGTLDHLEFEDFALAVKVTGTGRIDTLDITGPMGGCKTGIELDGAAGLNAKNVTTRALETALQVNDRSTLTLATATIAGDASCTNAASIDVLSTGTIAIDGTLIDGGSFGILFTSETTPTPATLTNTTIRNVANDGLGGRNVNLSMTGGALTNNQNGLEAAGGAWTFTNVMLTSNRGLGIYIQGTASDALGTLTMRGSTVSQNAIGIDVFDFGVADFGTATDPGGNTFAGNTDVNIDCDGNFGARLVPAVGNTWKPNVQGADAQGHYGAGTVQGPVAFVSGNNFELGSGWSLQR